MDELDLKYTSEFEKLSDNDLLDNYTYFVMQFRNGNKDNVPDVTTKISVIMDIAEKRNLNPTAYAVSKLNQNKSMMKEFKANSMFKNEAHPALEQVKANVDKQINKSSITLFIGIVFLFIGLALSSGSNGKVLFYGAIFVGIANIIVGGLGIILGMSTKSKIKKEDL